MATAAAGTKSLTSRKAWQALGDHFREIRDAHLRNLFSADPGRGERFTAEAARRGLEIAFPTLALSTDNAAMIAAAAWPRLQAGEFASQNLSANPSLALGQ